MGTTTMVAAAISRSYRMPLDVMKAYRPNGSVRTSVLLVTSTDHKNEFQQVMAFSRPMVTSAGLAMGTMMRHR